MFNAPKDVQRLLLNYTCSKALLGFSLTCKRYRDLIHETYYQQRSRCRLLQYARYCYKHNNTQWQITYLPNGNLEGMSIHILSRGDTKQYAQYRNGLYHGYVMLFSLSALLECSYYENGISHGNVYHRFVDGLSIIATFNHGKIVGECMYVFIDHRDDIQNISYYETYYRRIE